MITTLYMYFIPVIPDVYIFFRTFIRMVYPLIIFLYVEKYYNQDRYKERPKEIRNEAISVIKEPEKAEDDEQGSSKQIFVSEGKPRESKGIGKLFGFFKKSNN